MPFPPDVVGDVIAARESLMKEDLTVYQQV